MMEAVVILVMGGRDGNGVGEGVVRRRGRQWLLFSGGCVGGEWGQEIVGEGCACFVFCC